jgi:hypothetical protein
MQIVGSALARDFDGSIARERAFYTEHLATSHLRANTGISE